MAEINKLTAVDTIVAGDLFPVWSQANGEARKAAASVVLDYIQSNITANDDKITQYAAPSATGFTVTINDADDSIWLVLTPVAGYAAGTITLPAVANCADKQELLVNCTQSVGALTVSGNGATVTGAPTSLSANDYFRLRFDRTMSTWYRVG